MTADGIESERKLYTSDITGGGEGGGWCMSGCTAAITAGVLPATTYTLTIQAVNSLGASLVSIAALDFTTLADVPDRVTALQLKRVELTTAVVSDLASGKNYSLSIEVFNAQGSGGNSTP